MSGLATGGRPRVCVLMGGPGSEREVSLQTGATIARHLRSRADVCTAELGRDGGWALRESRPDGEDAGAQVSVTALSPTAAVESLAESGVDIVFNALHGPPGEDGAVQGFLQMHGLACTGPEGIAAAVTMDKRLTKLALVGAGVPTPPFFGIPAAEIGAGDVDWRAVVERERGRVPLPWVFKPSRLGSSVGVEFFADEGDVVARAAATIAAWPREGRRDALLVESAVDGRELSCAVVETAPGDARVLPPIELRPKHGGFFDYEAKYTPGATEELCPAPLSPETTAAVEELSLRVHLLFGCEPLSRTDLFLLPDGRLTVLEVNTLPGMTETSLVPLAAGAAGVSLAELLWDIVRHGLRRAAGFAGRGCDSDPGAGE